MASLKNRVLDWLELRLGLIRPLTEAATHPTPVNSASWLYVFGSAATVLLILQAVSYTHLIVRFRSKGDLGRKESGARVSLGHTTCLNVAACASVAGFPSSPHPISLTSPFLRRH